MTAEVLTPEDVDRKFYVYELWDSLKNEPFYVGKGQRGHGRDFRHTFHIQVALGYNHAKDPNAHKLNRIRKIYREGGEVRVVVASQTDDEAEAFQKERELITLYGRRDLKTGSLTNLTDGGEGQAGRVYGEAERQRIGRRVSGPGNPMYGKHHTDEVCRRISEARRNRKEEYRHTPEWREQLRTGYFAALNRAKRVPVVQIDRLDAPKHTRSVAQYDTDGRLIRTWPSQLAIKRAIGISNITLSDILQGKRKSPLLAGFVWGAL